MNLLIAFILVCIGHFIFRIGLERLNKAKMTRGEYCINILIVAIGSGIILWISVFFALRIIIAA